MALKTLSCALRVAAGEGAPRARPRPHAPRVPGCSAVPHSPHRLGQQCTRQDRQQRQQHADGQERGALLAQPRPAEWDPLQQPHPKAPGCQRDCGETGYGVPPSLTLGKEHFGPRGAFPWGRRQQEYQPAPTLWVFPNDSAHIRLCVLLILWEYSRPLNKAVARGTGSPPAPHAVENNF